MSVQQMAAIASRYFTAMADAMISACVAWCLERGEPLDLPLRPSAPRHEERPREEVDWQAMMERNSDTPLLHM